MEKDTFQFLRILLSRAVNVGSHLFFKNKKNRILKIEGKNRAGESAPAGETETTRRGKTRQKGTKMRDEIIEASLELSEKDRKEIAEWFGMPDSRIATILGAALDDEHIAEIVLLTGGC
jgi:hypothetical protein